MARPDGDEEEVAELELLGLMTVTDPTKRPFRRGIPQNARVNAAKAKRERVQRASRHRGHCWCTRCEKPLRPGGRHHRCSKWRGGRGRENKVLRGQRSGEVVGDRDLEVRLYERFSPFCVC